MSFMRSIAYSIIVATCIGAGLGILLATPQIYAQNGSTDVPGQVPVPDPLPVNPGPVESQNPPSNSAPSPSSPCAKGEIELNTNFPFLGRCIKKEVTGEWTNVANAFPYLMGVLVRVTMTIILVAGVLLIIWWGLMMTLQGSMGTASAGKALIMKVIVGLAVLGMSAIILNLINPNFFGTES